MRLVTDTLRGMVAIDMFNPVVYCSKLFVRENRSIRRPQCHDSCKLIFSEAPDRSFFFQLVASEFSMLWDRTIFFTNVDRIRDRLFGQHKLARISEPQNLVQFCSS